jgi:alkylation response protein AidB-like acyl-CoA dehydrogenase
VQLDEVLVPDDHVLALPGGDYALAMSTLELGRQGIAAQSVGIARSAFEYARRDLLQTFSERQSGTEPSLVLPVHLGLNTRSGVYVDEISAFRRLIQKFATERFRCAAPFQDIE